MTNIVFGGGSAEAYTIDNSLRFNDGDSPSLTKTATSFSSATTGTFSFWIKRGALGATQYLFALSQKPYQE